MGRCRYRAQRADQDPPARGEAAEVASSLPPMPTSTTATSTGASAKAAKAMAEALPEGLRPRFFGTHFFNPPRYMHLLELVPTRTTDPDVLGAFARFAEAVALDRARQDDGGLPRVFDRGFVSRVNLARIVPTAQQLVDLLVHLGRLVHDHRAAGRDAQAVLRIRVPRADRDVVADRGAA